MRLKKSLLIGFCFFVLITLHGQSSPYILDLYPALFAEIEQQLITEEITSVDEDCRAIINGKRGARAKGIAAFYLGQAAMLVRDFDLAEDAYREAIGFFKKTSFGKGLAILNTKRGELSFFQGDLLLANDYLDQAINSAIEEQLYAVLKDIYQLKANIFSASNEPDSTFFALKKALQVAGLLSKKDASKDILNQLATNYHAAGQLDSAILYFQDLIHLKEDINDVEGLISDYTALGNLLRERGAYDLAPEQYINALRLAEQNQDSFALVTIYTETGDLYAAQKQIDGANKNYQQALEIAILQEDDYWKAACFKRLGNLAVLQEDKPTAIDYYRESLALYEELGNKISAADVQIQLSQIYQDEDQYTQARAYLLEAIAIRQQSKDKRSLLQAKMALGELEIINDNHKVGIQYIEECIIAFEAMDNRKSLQQSYVILSSAYQQMNQYQKALEAYQTAMSLKDKLTTEENARINMELEEKYENEILEKKYLKQELVLEQTNGKIQRRNSQLIFLGSFLLIASLLIVSLFYWNKKNKQLNAQKIEVLKKEQETQQLKALIQGEEKERKRIGQELHDGLGAVLATVKMQISSIAGKIPEIENNTNYQKAEGLIDQACDTAREISHGMMPYLLEQQGLEAAMEDICQTFTSTRDIAIHFNPYQVNLIQSDILKFTIYRITQELLKNILKHAEASEVIVQLMVEDKQVELLVEDDGIGFDSKLNKKGIGLSNISSRVEYLNGNFEFDSVTGRGSTFLVVLPLK